MPFTLSHAAAVLPFTRTLSRWRALSAAVVGSMVPDFGYFLPWHMDRVETHSFGSLLTFSLPVGLGAYWMFEYLVKPATHEVLPDGGYIRSAPFAIPDPIDNAWQWLIASIAILAGAFSHLVWDGFTHENARGVQMIPMLGDPLVDIAGHSLMGYRLLQHGSSVLGLALIGAIIWHAMRPNPKFTPPQHRPLNARSRRRWMAVYVIAAVLLTAISFLMLSEEQPRPLLLGGKVENLAISGLRGLVAALFLVSIVLQSWLHAKKPQRSVD